MKSRNEEGDEIEMKREKGEDRGMKRERERRGRARVPHSLSTMF